MIMYTKEGSLSIQGKIKGNTTVIIIKGLANKNTLENSGSAKYPAAPIRSLILFYSR